MLSYLVLVLGRQCIEKLQRKTMGDSLEKLTRASIFAIAISSSISHVNVTLSWQACWDKNIEVHRNSPLTTNDKFIGNCNTVGWTTLMTSIVYSTNDTPTSFMINSGDLVLVNTDASFVQKNEDTLILPFGLKFPLVSNGLDLSNLPSSR
jgi:hypothetical protein